MYTIGTHQRNKSRSFWRLCISIESSYHPMYWNASTPSCKILKTIIRKTNFCLWQNRILTTTGSRSDTHTNQRKFAKTTFLPSLEMPFCGHSGESFPWLSFVVLPSSSSLHQFRGSTNSPRGLFCSSLPFFLTFRFSYHPGNDVHSHALHSYSGKKAKNSKRNVAQTFHNLPPFPHIRFCL